MSNLTHEKRAILHSLREAPRNAYRLAHELGLEPYRIRLMLRALKRDRLVTDEMTSTEYLWRLTDTGHALINGEDQLALTEAAS